MKAAAAGPGRSSGSLSLGWGSGLGWVVNVRTNVRRTCCFCAKTCAEHETPCTPCLLLMTSVTCVRTAREHQYIDVFSSRPPDGGSTDSGPPSGSANLRISLRIGFSRGRGIPVQVQVSTAAALWRAGSRSSLPIRESSGDPDKPEPEEERVSRAGKQGTGRDGWPSSRRGGPKEAERPRAHPPGRRKPP